MQGFWRGLAMLACAMVCTPALAAGFNVVAGPSVTSSGHVTRAVFASVFGDRPATGRAHFEPIATVGWVGPRSTGMDDLDHPVFLVAGGVRMVSGSGHWFFSEQLAATSHRTDALSSRFEFMTSGGWTNGHFVVLLRHASNGKLIGSGKNLGETMLLAGVRW